MMDEESGLGAMMMEPDDYPYQGKPMTEGEKEAFLAMTSEMGQAAGHVVDVIVGEEITDAQKTAGEVLDEVSDVISKEREMMQKKEEGYRLMVNEFISIALLQNRETRRNEPYCSCGASIEKSTREVHRESCVRTRNMLNMIWAHFEWAYR